jgi:hypothetical protein
MSDWSRWRGSYLTTIEKHCDTWTDRYSLIWVAHVTVTTALGLALDNIRAGGGAMHVIVNLAAFRGLARNCQLADGMHVTVNLPFPARAG